MLSCIKGVVTIFQEYQEPIKVNILNWLTPANLQAVLISLALAAAVIAGTYVLIKIANLILDRILRASSVEGAGADASFISSNMIQSLRALLKILILYGGYFLAAILILEIFKVKVITPGDLKQVGTNLLKIIGVIVGARLVVSLGSRAIKQVFERREIKDNLVEAGRLQTLEILLRSTFTYLIHFMAGLTILQIFNVNTAAILASAGILGLAVGFGAQSLVRDIISGFFIIFEDQFKVGDFVEAAGVIGVVEEVGIRTCKIRQWTGQLHVIPNGEISKVTNYSRGRMMAVVVVGIAYEEDIDYALEVLRRECEVAHREIEAIAEVPVVHGVIELSASSVDIRVAASTLPGEQWAVERELRRRFKYALDRADIEIPYPRTVMYHRGVKTGGEGVIHPQSNLSEPGD